MVAAVAALFVAFSGGDSGAGAAGDRGAAPRPRPLWSARRVPQPFVDAVGAQHLQAALDAAAPGAAPASSSQRAPRRSPRTTPTRPLIGASTQKLLAAAAALAILGPDSTFTDRAVVAPADPPTAPSTSCGSSAAATRAHDRRLPRRSSSRRARPRGDVTTSLEALADAIVAKGVQRDPRRRSSATTPATTSVRYLPQWKSNYRTDGEIGPLGALTVNDGFSAWSPSRRSPVDDPALNAGDAARRAPARPRASTSARPTPARRPRTPSTIAQVDVAAAAGHRRVDAVVERQPHAPSCSPRRSA